MPELAQHHLHFLIALRGVFNHRWEMREWTCPQRCAREAGPVDPLSVLVSTGTADPNGSHHEGTWRNRQPERAPLADVAAVSAQISFARLIPIPSEPLASAVRLPPRAAHDEATSSDLSHRMTDDYCMHRARTEAAVRYS